jgi:hypothetical protein
MKLRIETLNNAGVQNISFKNIKNIKNIIDTDLYHFKNKTEKIYHYGIL